MSFQDSNGEGVKIDHYNKLYALQDIVLKKVFSFNNSFYLTGGTALSRYYYHGRYSDDLDFFASKSSTYKEEYYQISQILSDSFTDFLETVSTRDFIRIIITKESVDLQVDFVNDYVYRHGLSVRKGDIKVDNIENICANKICAIIDRDEAKDICDLVTIAKNFSFKWDDIFAIAGKKQFIQIEVFLQRLQSFPVDWLSKLKYVNKDYNKVIIEGIPEVIESIKKCL